MHPFNFGSGEILHCSWEIDETKPLARQLWELRQDLIQVDYPHKELTLDIGWNPDFNPEGRFQLLVACGQDWDNPVHRYEAFTVEDLRRCVAEVVSKIDDNPNDGLT